MVKFRWVLPACLVFALGAPAVGFAQEPSGAKKKASSAEQKIAAALWQPAACEFIETPLSDVVDYLEDAHGIPMAIDHRALDEIGVGTDTPITANIKNVSLRAALRLILRPLKLKAVFRDESLLITSAAQADATHSLRYYQVADLTRQETPAGDEVEDPTALIQLITSIVQPNQWSKSGGPGRIAASRGLLAISHNSDAHREIHDLLAALRTIPTDGNAPVHHARQNPVVRPGRNWEPSLIAALDAQTSFEFIETPLRDVVEYLKDLHNISIRIDADALDDAGIGTDTPITMNLKGIRLRSALNAIFRPKDVTYVLTNEVILIVPTGHAALHAKTVVYPVADLVAAEGSNEVIARDLDVLAEMIRNLVAPDSWQEAGGWAPMGNFAARRVLVVSQTEENHRLIAEMLKKLRKARAELGQSGSPALPESSKLTTRVYHFGNLDGDVQEIEPAELESLVERLVEPQSWQGEGTLLEAIPGRLVVRQRPDVHRKVSQLLTTLGLQPIAAGQGGVIRLQKQE